jgi:hypothetical protein
MNVILGQMGVTIPPAFVRIFWIICLAFVGITALIFLFNMIGRM